MRKPRIGINGFGRIGRALFRNNLEKQYFDIVAINDINPDSKNIAYTLNYDSLYGRLSSPFKAEDGYLVNPNAPKVKVMNQSAIDRADWKSAEVDYVIDASGILANVQRAKKLVNGGGIKKVLVTHSPDESKVDYTLVLGANESGYDPQKHHVIASSICDATAIAPVCKLIHHAFGIESGFVTTVHPWLNYQNLLDGPAKSFAMPGEIYHHFAMGRSTMGNLIPKPTTALAATCKVLQAEGLTEEIIGSFSYRVPTAIVGSADLTLNLRKGCTATDVMQLFEAAEKSQQWLIIQNNLDPLVSQDFKQSDYSAIVDHRWTSVIQGKMLKMVLWYDNEWGYSSRVLDQIRFMDAM